MNVSQWVRAIHDRLENLPPDAQISLPYLSLDHIHQVISIALEAVADELAEGGALNTHLIGTLRTVTRPDRTVSVNLPGFDGVKRTVPARRAVRYRPSPGLIARLNAKSPASTLLDDERMIPVEEEKEKDIDPPGFEKGPGR
jgi:nucleoid DNA-binding protein